MVLPPPFGGPPPRGRTKEGGGPKGNPKGPPPFGRANPEPALVLPTPNPPWSYQP